MARRYLLKAVEDAVNACPVWTLSRDLKEAVNFNIQKNGWNRNIGAAHVGALARVLEEEGRIKRRPTGSYTKGLTRRYEYMPLIRI